MKKVIVTVLLLFLMCISNVHAYSTSASSAILMDTETNRIIYSRNMNKVRSVASISKIMTAILAIESGKLKDVVTIGEEIKPSYGSGIYVKVGEEITLEDLVYGLMLRSGNDAALAIAHYVSGDIEKFVEAMNKKAIEIGMKNTTFNNPSGLEDDGGNLSTAYDMAILSSYAIKNTTYQKITEAKTYKLTTNLNTYFWTNKNKLLNTYKYITGGKTGFTDVARRTLVTNASKNNLNLTAVTLNDGNDWSDHKALYEEAFGEYRKTQILKKGEINIIDEIYYKDESLYIKNDFYYPLNITEKDSIIIHFKLEKKVNYKNNDKVGELFVLMGDEEIYKDAVYIKAKTPNQSLFDKIKGIFSW